MTPAMLTTIVISAITISVSLIGLLVVVLIAVRRDSLATGKLGAEVAAFALKLSQSDAERAELLKTSDERVANALRASNDITSQREKDIIEAVKGFQATVDDLKIELASIRNMWAGERKLVEKIRELEVELVRVTERNHAMEKDLARLRVDHERNHPRESGPIPTHRQEGAPHALCGADEGEDK
jgi:hypothetical protein